MSAWESWNSDFSTTWNPQRSPKPGRPSTFAVTTVPSCPKMSALESGLGRRDFETNSPNYLREEGGLETVTPKVIPDPTVIPEFVFLSDETTTTLAESLPDERPTGEPEPEQEKAVVLPIYIYTAVFGAIFLLGPLLVRRGPNVGITRCCIMLSAFCCWIFWTTTYIVQMNPLLGPRLGNETLAWIGHKWGKNAINIRGVNETAESATDGGTAGTISDTTLESFFTEETTTEATTLSDETTEEITTEDS